jgi:hypothetical protein
MPLGKTFPSLFDHIPSSYFLFYFLIFWLLVLIALSNSVTDEEAINMSRFILKEEGLFIGSSSAVNLAASYKLAKNLQKLSRGKKRREMNDKKTTIVTILCDSGQRHLSKFWNNQFLVHNGFRSASSDKGIDGDDAHAGRV